MKSPDLVRIVRKAKRELQRTFKPAQFPIAVYRTNQPGEDYIYISPCRGLGPENSSAYECRLHYAPSSERLHEVSWVDYLDLAPVIGNPLDWALNHGDARDITGIRYVSPNPNRVFIYSFTFTETKFPKKPLTEFFNYDPKRIGQMGLLRLNMALQTYLRKRQAMAKNTPLETGPLKVRSLLPDIPFELSEAFRDFYP